MTKKIRFNYIITIYNTEDLIREVTEHVIKCCHENSYIYPVLDGCTDNSEKIIDEIISTHPNIHINKVFTGDVHELLSINAGLKAASQEGDGYNIILQDDVIIEDFELEKKVITLYEKEGEKLGYVSFRMGANLAKDTLSSRDAVPYTNYIENACGHGVAQAEMLPLGSIAYRTVPIKSPVCIPFKLINKVGMYNEKLAPYGHDDIDFSLRVINEGYYNLVYAIKFTSELEWGGTREVEHIVINSIIERNMDLIREWYPVGINKICSTIQNSKIKKHESAPVMTQKECEKLWNSKVSIQEKLKLLLLPAYTKIKMLKTMMFKNTLNKALSKFDPKFDKDLTFSEAIRLYGNRNDIYLYFYQYYYHKLPQEIKNHREYIENNNKGFGEQAFHSMWWKLISEFKPENVLEIGVYRGQVISLWVLIAKLLAYKIEVSGISPFSSFGDSVSDYMKNLDYYQDIQDTFEELGLEKPTLIKGFSKDPVAVEYIKSRVWDMVYIDGGHDYKDVLFDYKLCLENLKEGGLIIFDDASLYTDYEPVSFSFKGHPGPSLVAREHADKEMNFIGAVGHNNIYTKL